MDIALLVVAGVFGFLTLASLIVGIFAMAHGGRMNQRSSNRLMRARVLFQALTLLILFMLFAS